jgi:hypothetical protein
LVGTLTKIDGGLRPLFQKNLSKLGFHCQSIETGGTGRGIPDFNFCKDGIEGWIEFKKTSAWAVSNISPDQIGWVLRRRRAGGGVFLAVRRQRNRSARKKAVDELWIFDGLDIESVSDEGLKSHINPLRVWEDDWNWEEIGCLLLR